jgi:hypothetical protein
MQKEGEILLGHVRVDSGKLMICDPCYIGSEWKDEDFDWKEAAIHPDGTEEEIERCSERWFELIDDINAGKITLKDISPPPKHNFSYNAVSKATLNDKGFGQLNFTKGHPGVAVAFRSGIGDGVYPVYGKIEEVEGWGERITEVRIEFIEHPLLEEDEDIDSSEE